MNERRAYEALSSASRLEILRLLQRKPLTVKEIAKLMDLKPITVRHHLHSLEEAGFVESHEKKSGTAGRPEFCYRIAKELTAVSYPKRHYLTLSNVMMKTLQSAIGPERANKLLRRVGRSIGESVVKEIESKHHVREWSLEAFRDLFIERYLEEAGAYPEIVSVSGNQIVYREHNCLVLELAVETPETICDIFHEGFHEGISKAIGGKVKIVRLTCQGHGDPYCEHSLFFRRT